ncbi:hypothetical protein AACH06_24030 [Ideonella sp. DXS29W]|uniref:Uncharacterized protein n=1 Tax=Ideonella lacteola TaxID=2984193 RepID=A0ABU9BVM4_9BURK
MSSRLSTRHALMSLAIGVALLGEGTPVLAATKIPGINAPVAGVLPHVEGEVDGKTFHVRAPASLEESVQYMEADDKPMVDQWGLSSVFTRLGFRQLVIFPDRSALIITVAMPDSVKEVRTGSWPLGGTTIDNTNEGSNEGWSGACPAPEPDNAHVIITHFAAPPVGAPAPMRSMIPAGRAIKTYESHLTFPQVDEGTLEITKVDRAGRVGRVEGRVKGQVSRIRVLLPNMGPDEACNRANYNVETQRFDVKFHLEIGRGF